MSGESESELEDEEKMNIGELEDTISPLDVSQDEIETQQNQERLIKNYSEML